MANKIKKMMNNGTAYTVGGIESSNDTYENIIHLTQAEYDALETKDPDTLYSTPDNAESGAFSPENEGTEGQVLMRTENGYAWCDAPGGLKYANIDVLIVGGGGGGGAAYNVYHSGGGGAGGFIECQGLLINNQELCYPLSIGEGGIACNYRGINGGNTTFNGFIAYGGGGGGGYCNSCSGGSGGSGGGAASCGNQAINSGGAGCNGQGNKGGGSGGGIGGGGGGAGEAGYCGCGTSSNGKGGDGKCSCISGECVWYAGGGGGASGAGGGLGQDGCGGGGNVGGEGKNGLVIIRYKTDGSCGIKPLSGGGYKYTCGEYTIHCFTTNDIFMPVFK